MSSILGFMIFWRPLVFYSKKNMNSILW